jgi:ribosomal protein L34E
MVAPRLRSKSKKRGAVRTPTGRKTLHFKGKRPGKASCRICGALLGGVSVSHRATRSEKGPSRMFAGELCGSCVGRLVSLKARIAHGAAAQHDASLAQQKYLKMMR